MSNEVRRVLIARCPRCNGWTMFHAEPDSATAKEWAAISRLTGDVVSVEEEEPVFGTACPDSWGNEGPASQRGCPAA